MHSVGFVRLARWARSEVLREYIPQQSRTRDGGGRMSEFVAGIVVGCLAGGVLGFHLGTWTAAWRAARATYRTQRGLR